MEVLKSIFKIFKNIFITLKNIILIVLMILISPITYPLGKYLKRRKK